MGRDEVHVSCLPGTPGAALACRRYHVLSSMLGEHSPWMGVFNRDGTTNPSFHAFHVSLPICLVVWLREAGAEAQCRIHRGLDLVFVDCPGMLLTASGGIL